MFKYSSWEQGYVAALIKLGIATGPGSEGVMTSADMYIPAYQAPTTSLSQRKAEMEQFTGAARKKRVVERIAMGEKATSPGAKALAAPVKFHEHPITRQVQINPEYREFAQQMRAKSPGIGAAPAAAAKVSPLRRVTGGLASLVSRGKMRPAVGF